MEAEIKEQTAEAPIPEEAAVFESDYAQYTLSPEQRAALPAEAQVCLAVGTDMSLRKFSSSSSMLLPRTVEVTGLDKEDVIKANQHLRGVRNENNPNLDRPAYIAMERRNVPGSSSPAANQEVRITLTHYGGEYLREQVQAVGGTVLRLVQADSQG